MTQTVSHTPSHTPSHKVHVDLGERSYDIHVGPALLTQAALWLKPLLSRPALVVIADAAIAENHLATLISGLEEQDIDVRHYIVASGEASKSFAQVEQLCEWLLDQQLSRGDLIVALGGGVIGDLTGFAAAILKRGTRFVQIPTTLLAQVDSSVGGKTGINTRHGKNLIGAFHQPEIVLADTSVLGSLPERDYRAGYAEIIKYGVLGDADFFKWLESENAKILARDPDAVMRAVTRSCEMKAEIVKRDERETGDRALLNLGHTFAHAFEAYAGYDGKLLHGEAVGLGMVLAMAYSVRRGLCPQADATRVADLVAAAGLPATIGDIAGRGGNIGNFIADDLLNAIAQDKKVIDGRLRLVLARAIGAAFVEETVDANDLKQFLIEQGASDAPDASSRTDRT